VISIRTHPYELIVDVDACLLIAHNLHEGRIELWSGDDLRENNRNIVISCESVYLEPLSSRENHLVLDVGGKPDPFT